MAVYFCNIVLGFIETYDMLYIFLISHTGGLDKFSGFIYNEFR